MLILAKSTPIPEVHSQEQPNLSYLIAKSMRASSLRNKGRPLIEFGSILDATYWTRVDIDCYMLLQVTGKNLKFTHKRRTKNKN